MEIGAATDVGRVREGNEDYLFVREPLFIVADGMGGHRAGEVASRMAVEAFVSSLDAGQTGPDTMEVAVRYANRVVYEAARTKETWKGMGTTLSALYVHASQALLAQVGDSRIYRLRDGQFRQATQDHSVVAEMVRLGSLTEEEARSHPQRNLLTRALGVGPDVEVDIFTQDARAGDIWILATDGLTGMITDSEIQEIAARESPKAAADQLVELANSRGGLDNISVIVVQLEPETTAGM